MKYLGLLLLFCLMIGPVWAQSDPDTNLIFPINPTYDPTQTTNQSFDLGDPSSVNRTIVYDPVTGKYIFTEVIGNSGLNYRNPSMKSLEEYIEYERQKALTAQQVEKSKLFTEKSTAIDLKELGDLNKELSQIKLDIEKFEKVVKNYNEPLPF